MSGTFWDSNGVNLETAIREYDFYEDIKTAFNQLQEVSFFLQRETEAALQRRDRGSEEFSCVHIMGKSCLWHRSQACKMSESRFAHVFKKETGISFWEYVKSVRMEHAEKMLKETDLRIGDIAEKSGWIILNYFSAQFKKRKGKSPLAWRNMTEQGSDRK